MRERQLATIVQYPNLTIGMLHRRVNTLHRLIPNVNQHEHRFGQPSDVLDHRRCVDGSEGPK